MDLSVDEVLIARFQHALRDLSPHTRQCLSAIPEDQAVGDLRHFLKVQSANDVPVLLLDDGTIRLRDDW